MISGLNDDFGLIIFSIRSNANNVVYYLSMIPESFDEDILPLGHNPENAVLHGKLEHVKSFLDALNCIYSPQHKGQDVTITMHSDGGLRFTVQHAGCLQAAVIVPASAFSSFHSSDASLRLRLNLSLLMESLHLFGSSSTPASAQIWHIGSGHPLVLRLWDGSVDTICELKTLECEDGDDVDFGFFAHEVVCTAVVDSETIRDALNELDYGGATSAEIRVSPQRPRFVLSSPARTIGSELDGNGEEALCSVELPDPHDRNDETFQSFSCERVQCGVFKLEHLQRCRNGLGVSESCKVQMNDYGMVSIVCRMRATTDVERGRGGGMDRCFVEFVVVAQEIDEEEEEEGQEAEVEQEVERGEEEERDDDENERWDGEDSEYVEGTQER